MNKTLLALATSALLAAGSAAAADLQLLNLDNPGVGLNDTTPAAPVGGNPGTTKGAQATFVYEFAMKCGVRYWRARCRSRFTPRLHH